MNTDLTSLKPALVWKHFAAMTQIPRPSFHEEKIRRYVLDVARSLGLECREDAAHNVYVRKPASKGMENRAGVILQAHLDMVPQKNNDKKFDFLKDPIRAYVDGDWVTADGTTLGADNGIGAAAILAVLEDDTLEHGPLEALFTATEGLLKGDILLNLDSETEGELYVGCAGGLDANIRIRSVPEPTPARNYTAAIVAVDQLTKYLAAANLVGKTVTLIPGWLQLHYITNDGMALSLLRGARWLFVVMTAVYLAVVIYVLVKKWFKKTPELWCIAAITGGAIGNFIDRISTGLVIDMICIPWFSTFNVADLFITFGALVLVIYILTKDKELLADKPKEQKKPHDADA